ncbi:YjiH family protein [Gallaecimonas pentaromativorans]|uniref:Nucleoside recognition membrane protein YjiH n=1 Tax=Gallaecimonas pentaromativorans TaxID=584787 RepID=A0A3N1PG04_9GAMM|nr:nucleoside recognition membrane protein YjiH [Gallaecimonas pentaromativorans]
MEKVTAADAPQFKGSRLRNYLMFLIPSLIGIGLFMTPLRYQGDITIAIAVVAKSFKALLEGVMPILLTLIVSLSALVTVFCQLFKPAKVMASPFLKGLFCPNWLWTLVRVIGAVFAVLIYSGKGPAYLLDPNTGGLVFGDLLPTLFSVFIFAGLLLPLLLDFGLLEFVGTLMTKVMRPVFKLPGRSAVDCFASWLGDGSVGILLTGKQYEGGFYTQKEAAIIGTTFSAVSITFSLVVLAQVKLEGYFLPFYGAICLAGVVAAIVVPRLPPLRWKKDHFIGGSPRTGEEEAIPGHHGVMSFGLERALHRADSIESLKKPLGDGIKNALDMLLGVLPVVMAVGTIALLIAEHTPVFGWLGKPFVPYLELLGIPEAVAASKTVMVGFADMFIPSVLITGVDNEMTRFVVAAMSVTQLIYLSEVGALLLGSRIPVNFIELFVIFILRTLVTLPVIAAVAHWVF